MGLISRWPSPHARAADHLLTLLIARGVVQSPLGCQVLCSGQYTSCTTITRERWEQNGSPPLCEGTAWETDRIGTRVPSALAGVDPYRSMPATSSLCQGGSGGEVLTPLKGVAQVGDALLDCCGGSMGCAEQPHVVSPRCRRLLGTMALPNCLLFYVSLSLSLFPFVNLFSFLKGLYL